MAPKAAAKPKKAIIPIPEPEDKSTPPDLTAVAADFRATDHETQQQALTRLFAIKEYPGAKIAVGSPDIVTGLLTLASSDSNEVQTCSAHCLARFAAWQGAAQLAICTPKNAEILWRACFLHNKTAAGALKVVSKEFLEGSLRCLASMCFASQSVCQQLGSFSKAPLVALYQHSSPKIQERACQLTCALTVDKEACKSLVPGSLQGLLALCSMASPAAVREQACHALCRLARPSAGCHACSHLQAAGTALILLQLLQGAGDSSRSSSQADQHAAVLLRRVVEASPQAAMEVLEAGGLQTLLNLLPAPESSLASADAASATPATAASTAAAAAAVTATASSWANRPASHRLQASLLQLLAAIMQSQQARSALLAADSNSSASSSSCVAVLLNIIDPEAPAVPVATPAAVAAPAGGKGAAVGKADGKAKAAGKGKPEAPAEPPAELVPPFPDSVQLPAVQCLQELAKEPALVLLLLKGPLLKHLAKILMSPTDQLVQHAAVLLQYVALNAETEQLPAAEVKAVMSSLAQHSLNTDNQVLQTAVGSAACSLPPFLLLPDVKPPLPSPPKTPPPPPLPLSEFIWDAMGYDKLSPKQFAVV